MSRAGALKKNMLAGWLSEAVSLISGLVLPRLVLVTFGSSCNGMINSIVQFLGFASILRAGVGAVTKAALFRPLAQNDLKEISKIMSATQSYMRKVTILVGIYILFFAILFPFIVEGEFGWWYMFSMVLIIGSSTFVENLFGIKYRILLQADQKYYIETLGVIITQITSLVVSVILIKAGHSIHVVKIGAAMASFLNPLFVTLYVKKNYSIDMKAVPDFGAIKQRWDAFAQHLAVIINSNIDLILMSFFVPLKEISVYTVHHMISFNLEKVVTATISGIGSTFGNIMANDEDENLKRTFCFIEWGLFAGCTVIFSVTSVMITPFVKIYTNSVTDVNYIRPVFAIAMTIAAMANCMKRPYQLLVEAAGHFKQTRNGAILEVIVHIAVSLIMLYFYGIIGVAVGTLVASFMRTVQYGIYSMKNILNLHIFHGIKMYFTYLLTFGLIVAIFTIFPVPNELNYFLWALYAAMVTVVALLITVFVSLIFNKEQVIYLKNRTIKKMKKSI